ncbi:MAG: SPOR domain-containing protein [Pseudomonadales bacterium]|nr:SPOR domain-containing protein [Pseudomonadales bacterium]
MDTRLKHRVIGAIILSALAIIILPMLLDGSADDRARVIADIPDPPAIELKALSVSQLDRKISAMEQASAAKLPERIPDDEATPADKTAVKVTEDASALRLDQNHLPEGWSLQVASFREQENAVNLRASLRQQSLQSYIIQAKTEDGNLYRVFVGPMLQKSRLEKIQGDLEAKYDLKGTIVKYKMEDDAGQLGG